MQVMKLNPIHSKVIGPLGDFVLSSGAMVSGIHAVGQVKDQFSLGTKQRLAEHGEQMKKFADMEFDKPGKVSLDPGEKGAVVMQVTRSYGLDFACRHPGRYEAGTKGQVKISRH